MGPDRSAQEARRRFGSDPSDVMARLAADRVARRVSEPIIAIARWEVLYPNDVRIVLAGYLPERPATGRPMDVLLNGTAIQPAPKPALDAAEFHNLLSPGYERVLWFGDRFPLIPGDIIVIRYLAHPRKF